MEKMTKDTLFLMVDVLIDLYLGIYGTEEIEVVEAIIEGTDLTFEDLQENYPSLTENIIQHEDGSLEQKYDDENDDEPSDYDYDYDYDVEDDEDDDETDEEDEDE
jgi:hypothetical protein